MKVYLKRKNWKNAEDRQAEIERLESKQGRGISLSSGEHSLLYTLRNYDEIRQKQIEYKRRVRENKNKLSDIDTKNKVSSIVWATDKTQKQSDTYLVFSLDGSTCDVSFVCGSQLLANQIVSKKFNDLIVMLASTTGFTGFEKVKIADVNGLKEFEIKTSGDSAKTYKMFIKAYKIRNSMKGV